MNKLDRKRIDWLITLAPFISIMLLAGVLFVFPNESNNIISKVRFFFGDTVGIYYLVIGLAVLLVSVYLAFSKYGNVVLGEPNEKPKYSFFVWGSMMFTCGLAADILFYSFAEWVMYAYGRTWLRGRMGRRFSTVSLELYSVGILSGTCSRIRFYVTREKKKSSEIFGSMSTSYWETCGWCVGTCD